MTTIIGFIVLAPFDDRDPSFLGFLKSREFSKPIKQIVTLDPHLCDSFPEEYDYSLEDEPCLKFSGNIKLFKQLKNARSQLVYEKKSNLILVALGVPEQSSSQSIFSEFLVEEYGTDYKEALFREVESPGEITWLGWDVADIQGISLLATTYKDQPSFPVNEWGLLDNKSDATQLAEFGNRIWHQDGQAGHGPFSEWRLGRVDDAYL